VSTVTRLRRFDTIASYLDTGTYIDVFISDKSYLDYGTSVSNQVISKWHN